MTIKEASQVTGVSADTLRYYERIGLIPPVPRNESGIRNYDEASIGWINFIKCMCGAGLPIEALIEYVALCKEGDKTEASRKAILIEQRDILQQRIESLQKTLVKLNYKIDNYGHLNQEAIKNIKWNE
ncbi:MerR family transcriptional regulator [Phascolarctobacterium sp.]|uniref:MerR family transcriptional regulator n=1 Tax=Phascolarctobacterium sp. TaxID=2049039 RepID=UPI002A7EE9CA|nr:MerR family transcriptional regulator [Phascolarctobacterium sp.]MDY5045340.1 MerR family transcriptional regulator [Phascolarctobacterium sp.]